MQPRIMGIDFGLVRVGLAIADPLRLFATPYGTFTRKEAISRLVDVRDREGLERIVLGWPLRLDGTEGETVSLVRKFERQVEGALPGVPIVRWDERYTSVMAERAVRSSGRRRTVRSEKHRIDAAAAAILLQSYLDALNDAPESTGI